MTHINIPTEQSAGFRLSLSSLIVTPDWLAQHIDHPSLRLLDVRLRESYAEGHIPGAAWVDLEALTDTIDGVPGMLVPPELFAQQMGQLGIDQNSSVVLYDDYWGMPAARVLWSLARYGHETAAVLTGGSDRWRQEGRPWTPEPFVPPAAHFTVRPVDQLIAEYTWLQSRLDDPNTVLIDTRTPGEYAQGHLPGALGWDWMNGVPAGSWDTLRPAAELLTELESLGVTPDKEIVTYCQSGARSAHTHLLLRSLGFQRVRNYDGSWLEWSHYNYKT